MAYARYEQVMLKQQAVEDSPCTNVGGSKPVAFYVTPQQTVCRPVTSYHALPTNITALVCRLYICNKQKR